MSRTASTYREHWALLLTGEHGQDLTTRDRCIGLRVCLAADDDGRAEDLDLARISTPEGITNVEVRAGLRRLWRQHWIIGELDQHDDVYDLELGVPWWALDPELDNELERTATELEVFA